MGSRTKHLKERLNPCVGQLNPVDVGIFVEHWWKKISSRRLSPHQYFCFVGAGYFSSSDLDSSD
jgi:hypothetical protein